MKKKARNRLVAVSIVWLCATGFLSAQTCTDDFTIKTTSTPSTCQANGTITVTTAENAENIFNMEYSLNSVVPGFTITPQPSNVLSNLPPGAYNITVRAFCKTDASFNVVKTANNVVVGGNYVVTSATFNENLSRKSYPGCGSGKIVLDVKQGNGSYTFTIVSAPAGVATGAVTPTKSGTTYTLPSENYPAGGYVVEVYDGCYTAAVNFTLGEISGFPAFFYDNEMLPRTIEADYQCEKLNLYTGAVNSSNPDYYKYFQAGMYEVGVAPLGQIPQNWTIWKSSNIKNYLLTVDISPYKYKDLYGSSSNNTISVYTRIKGCPDTYKVLNTYMQLPVLDVFAESNECSSFTAKLYSYDRNIICYPLAITIKKSSNDSLVWSAPSLSYVSDPYGAILAKVSGLEYGTQYNIYVVDNNNYSYMKTYTTPNRPVLSVSTESTFCEGYKISYNLSNNACWPAYIAFKKSGGEIVFRDTLNNLTRKYPDILFEYGVNYTIETTYANADPVYTSISTYRINSIIPTSYKLTVSPDKCSEDRGYFNVSTSSSSYKFPAGTTISITGPAGYTPQSVVCTSSSSQYSFGGFANNEFTSLPPGTYTATIDHGCGTPITVVLNHKGVYSGKVLRYTAERTCEGLKIYPQGAITFGGDSVTTYYRLTSGPSGYDPSVKTSGQSFTLSAYGTYELGILWNNDAKGCVINTVTINYSDKDFALSSQDTRAYVCVESTVATIIIKAINGVAPYTYELWNKDNTVKLVDAVTSSDRVVFNYGEAGITYTVRYKDACSSNSKQQITPYKLGTAHIVYTDKNSVCYGDTIELNCLTLGDTGCSWTGPDGFTSDKQNPRIGDATPAMAGWYKVSIQPEFCGSAVQDSVYIDVYNPLLSTSDDNLINVCSGDPIQELISGVTGGCGNYTYQWQRSTDGLLDWTNIANATSISYTPPVFTQAGDYYYRRMTYDDCGAVAGDVTTIRVHAMPTADAGADQAQHKKYVFTMQGSEPAIGSGIWSVHKGSVTVDEPANPHSRVEVGAGETSATLVWTVNNNGCMASDTVVLYTRNYWYGTLDTDWTKGGNWTSGIVPGEYEDIEFATNSNNDASGGGNGQGKAINDLYTPKDSKDLTIGNLINASDKNLIIPAGSGLTVSGVITITDPMTGVRSKDPSKIQIKAQEGKPNGTLIVNCADQRSANEDVYVTVDLYAKGYLNAPKNWTDNIPGSPTLGQTFTTSYHWQYIGVPVASVQADPTFHGAAINEYAENFNGDNTSYYHKWRELKNSSVLSAFKGYEITQKTPATYSIAGKLVYCDADLTMTRRAPQILGAGGANTYYGLGQNIFGNSFTSSIDVETIEFPAEAEQTVYLYNTGRFSDWGNASPSPNDGTTLTAGQYTAIPKFTASAVYDGAIPSMNGFLVKFTTEQTLANYPDATLRLKYAGGGVKPNTRPQTVKKEPLSYINIRLNSRSTVDHLWLFSHPGTSSGFDNGWDGRKFFGTPTAYIYKETPGGLMQVNADKTLDGSLISFYANEDTEYTLTLSKSNLDAYEELHLVDLISGGVIPLDKDTTVYSFTALNKGCAEKRFQLVNASSAYLESEKYLLLNGYMADGQSLRLINHTGGEGRVRLYDMTGRTLFEETLFSGTYSRDVSLRSGIYILHLEAEGKQTSVKLVVQ